MPSVIDSATMNNLSYHTHLDADGNSSLDVGYTPPAGWSLLKAVDHQSTNGDFAAIFVNPSISQIYYASRGTVPTNVKDIVSDAGIALNTSPELRINDAINNIKELQSNEAFAFYTFMGGGHSLGGDVMAGVSAALARSGNPFYVLVQDAPNKYLFPADSTNVLAIKTRWDIVGNLGFRFANEVTIRQGQIWNQFGAGGTHKLDDLNQAIKANPALAQMQLGQKVDPNAIKANGNPIVSLRTMAKTSTGANIDDYDTKVTVQSTANQALLETITHIDPVTGETISVTRINIAEDGTQQGTAAEFNTVTNAIQRIDIVESDTLNGNPPVPEQSVILDNNANAAPLGTVVDPNKFYISGPYNTLTEISKATGTPITQLQSANPGVNPNTSLNNGTTVNLPPVDNSKSPIIQVNPNPQAQTGTPKQSDAANNTSQGYVSKSATSSVKYNNNTLNASTLVAATMGGMASGGVRPGERQLDHNTPLNDSLNPIDSFDRVVDTDALFPPATLYGQVTQVSASTRAVYIDPLLLDLGTGIGTTSFRAQPVFFDMDHSGTLKSTSWADSNTGILAIADANGKVTNISQLFSPYFGGSAGNNGGVGSALFTNGFTALAAQDTNHDGMINSSDAIWSQLRVWVDGNHDANVGLGELKTLSQLGITQINVSHTPSEAYNNGNRISATGSFVRNGQTVQMADVDLISDPTSSTLSAMGNGTLITSTSNGTSVTGYTETSTLGVTLNANTLGVDNLFAGSGNDTLIARTTGSMLVGGAGSDTYQGGAGDDLFIVSADDDPANISGGGGTDILVVTGDAGMTINMAQTGVTIAEGGKGNDVIMSGGRKGVYIKGGIGNSLLIGGAGDDVIMGGSGHNTIIGGTGKALIHAGPQGDLIYGAAGSSIINAGGGEDTIIGGASDDLIKVGMGNAKINGGGGTNLVEFHGSYAEYRIVKVDNGYWIADRIPNRDGTVFINHVQKLNFSDIQAVDLTLPNALPVADTLRVNSSGASFNHTQQHLISAAQLLANDHRLASTGALRISAVSSSVGGTASLTAAGDVLFTPDSTYIGIMSFKYTVADAQGHPAGSVVDLNTGQTAPMRAKVMLATPELPTDPLMAKQWYLNDANILPVWKDYTGKGVRIGQFEPGGEFSVEPEILNYKHSDLAPNIDQVWLATEKANGTLPTSFSNHATMVAGVMVAANNGTGAVGVAYDATISGYYLTSAQDAAGLGHMASYDVANNSWAFSPDFAASNFSQIGQLLNSTAHYAADNGRGGLGTVIVGAAGNERTTQGSAQGSFSNNNRFTLQVGAINQQGDLSTLSQSQTPFSNAGSSILVSAPGSNIASTSQVVVTDSGSIFGNNTGSLQGTSFATPIVSGIVALMLEANPNLGYRDVQEILALSSHKIVDSNTTWDSNKARNWNGGGMHVSNDYGFGEVDALAAVRLAETWTIQQTGTNEASYSVASNVNQTVNAGKSMTSTLSMSSGLTVEHIEVDLGLTFSELDDLTVKLTAPNGTESILLKNNDPGSSLTSLSYTFMSTHSWGELSAGNWTLQVTNATNGHPVNLNGWTLRLYGNQTTADDTYIYTNEFAAQKALASARGTLNDSVNGSAGGINTINAAAVTGNTSINLNSTTASIGGTSLTIQNPSQINNLFSGDGNDTLTAGSKNAILDGGRGSNTLTGGAGTDLFVVRQRENGQDTIASFKTTNGEVIDLVGFTNLNFSNLTLTQQGADVRVGGLGAGQSIVLKSTNVASLNTNHFVFQSVFTPPSAYTTTGGTGTTLPAGVSAINLQGGWTGTLISFQNGTLTSTLRGTVYQHDSATTDYFLIKAQSAADTADNSYNNAIQGFKHGTDKIDLSVLGIAGFTDLTITKEVLYSINGTPVIQGVKVYSNSLGANGTPRELFYLNALEVNQVTASDFIFAPRTGETVSTPPTTQPISPNIIAPNLGQIDPGLIGSNNGISYTQDGNGVVTVHSAVNFALPETINNLELTGDKDIIGTANNNGNTIIGNTGQDTLIGGTGNDTFVVNNSGDLIVESVAGGTDTVQASVSYALSDNIENLTLTGTSDLNGTGNALSNLITGNSGANIIAGGAGNDTLNGGAGNDTYVFTTGFGTDSVIDAGGDNSLDFSTVTSALTYNGVTGTVTSGTGSVTWNPTTIRFGQVLGAAGNDHLIGGTFNETLTGGVGHDTLTGGAGNDSLVGGAGNNTYVFSSGFGLDTISGSSNTDTLDFSAFTTALTVSLSSNAFVQGASDTVTWGANAIANLTTGLGDDALSGTAGNNLLNGGNGNNTFSGGAGNDTLVGGSGNDRYTFTNGFGTDSVSDAGGNNTLDFSTVSAGLIYNAILGTAISGPSALTWNPINTRFNQILGAAGDDSLTGGIANETLMGGAGNDTLTGGAGNDSLVGGAGNNTYVFSSGFGLDTISGSSNTDTLDFSAFTTALSLDLGTGSFTQSTGNSVSWTPTMMVNITTGSGNDSLMGTAANNLLNGGNGNNTLNGGAGNDTLVGGSGNDLYVFSTGFGSDHIVDATGLNTLDFSTLTTGLSYNALTGTAVSGTGSLTWDTSVTHLNQILGAAGNDGLTGGAGNETLTGGVGNDTLTGGAGNDSLVGSSGNDTYTFASGFGNDSISDSSGNDTLDFSAFSTGVNLNLGNNAFTQSPGNTLSWASNALENLTTGSGDDALTGSNGSNLLNGGNGNNTFNGGLGNDTLMGGTGNDIYNFINGFGTDSISDAGGNNLLNFSALTTALAYNAVAGKAFSGSGSVTWNPATTQMSQIWGGAGNDTLTGGPGAETFSGGAGNDVLTGGSNNDRYVFTSGFGVDSITDAGGTNTLDFNAFTTALSINLGNNALIQSAGHAITWTASSMQNLVTGSGNDTLLGTAANNILNGGNGNNTLNGGAGNDTLIAGTGNDTYVFANGYGADSIMDAGGSNLLNFSAVTGDLTYNAVTGSVISGTGVVNWNASTTTFSQILGAAGNNGLTGGAANETLTGGVGNDTLTGGAGNDSLVGGSGNDTYTFASGFGNDSISDISGNDTLDFSAFSTGLLLNLTGTSFTQSTGNSVNWGANSIENLTIGSGDDTLTGTSGSNLLIAGNGNNTLTGGAGNDTLVGGTGNDTYVFVSGSGVDSLTDAGGTDTLDFRAETSAVTFTAGSATVGSDAVAWNTANTSIEQVLGGSGNDLLTGGTGNETLSGGTGNDLLNGGAGNNVYAFSNNWGSDTINSSSGTDTVDLSAVTRNLSVTMWATAGPEVSDGTSAIHWSVNNIENLNTGSGNDTINADNGNNILSGGAGNDIMNANNGNDTLTGGAGNDTLNGGTGNDWYRFALGDGQDVIQENDSTTGNLDTVSFNNTVTKSNVAFFMLNGNLQMGYVGNSADLITVQGQNTASGSVERFQASDGTFMTNADVNAVIQNMASYATTHGVSFTSLNDVKNNTGLMSLVAAGWHS